LIKNETINDDEGYFTKFHGILPSSTPSRELQVEQITGIGHVQTFNPSTVGFQGRLNKSYIDHVDMWSQKKTLAALSNSGTAWRSIS
jgi:hypothetical protein